MPARPRNFRRGELSGWPGEGRRPRHKGVHDPPSPERYRLPKTLPEANDRHLGSQAGRRLDGSTEPLSSMLKWANTVAVRVRATVPGWQATLFEPRAGYTIDEPALTEEEDENHR